jgi:hypothetical protein
MILVSRSAIISQCNGNITLSTQAQVDAFSCNTFTGNLKIQGTDITDLNPLFNNSPSLQHVTGDLAVINCPNLTSLQGLDGVQDVGGEFIVNNTGITTFGNFAFQLVSAGEFFIISHNSLSSISINGGGDAFPFLTSVGNRFSINQNPSLTSISGFSSLNTVNTFGLIANSNLVDVSAFQDLNVSNDVIIKFNPQLSLCCFAEYMLNNNGGTDDINGNAPGCNSVAEIMAPPVLSPCPTNSTVSASASTCGASVSFTDPSIIDNCGIDTYTALITLGDGTIYFSGNAVPGAMFTYPLTVGNNTFVYTATDTGGNTSSCSTTVSVVDNVPPVFPSSGQTITGICGVDDPNTLFFANAPLATDNCGISGYVDPFVDTPLCGSSFTRTYTTTATDVNGNTATFVTTINMVDNTPPVFSGIPADVTIFCGDPMPSLPNVTASDQCAGNVTSNITVASSVALGNCTFNTPGEITTFSWTVNDGCMNSITEEWTVTRINNFEFSLGDDVAVCNVSNYSISAPSGASYLWSNGATTQSITVSLSGNYTVTITNAGGCCNEDMINVTFGTNPNASATGAQLNCTGAPVTIMGSSTSSGVNYAWTGPGGFTSALQNPSVNVAGTYTLTVTNVQGCTSSATAVVTANTSVPNASATGATITCSTPTVTIMGTSSTPGVTYAWTGPNNLQNPIVSTPGTYNLVVTAPNACIANASAVVVNNTTLPTSTLNAPPITCITPSVTINNVASANATTYAWTGPNNFTSNLQSPTVTIGGIYNLIVTANNGCTNTNTITVTLNNTQPDASATGASLSCSASAVVIMGASSTPDVSYSWSGPNGYTSGLQSPQVSFVGTYTLTVTSLNGCTATALANVVADANAPVVTTTGGDITCVVTSVTLMATSSITGSTFAWSGPSGFASTLQNPVVTVPGSYTVIVTAPNNCKTTSGTIVNNDISVPSISITLGSVDCAASTRLLNGMTNVTNPTMTWTGPNGFAFSGLTPSISLAGTYTASVTGTNGCINSATTTIANSIAYTTNIATTDATSTTLGTATINIEGGTPNFNIVWDNGVTGTTNSTLTAGNHNVIVVDGLGCTKVIPFVIIGPVGTQEDQRTLQITLSPNPATDRIELTSAFSQEIIYSIINSQGQILTSPAKYHEVIDISLLDPGVFYLKINVGDKLVSRKFIKY